MELIGLISIYVVIGFLTYFITTWLLNWNLDRHDKPDRFLTAAEAKSFGERPILSEADALKKIYREIELAASFPCQDNDSALVVFAHEDYPQHDRSRITQQTVAKLQAHLLKRGYEVSLQDELNLRKGFHIFRINW